MQCRRFLSLTVLSLVVMSACPAASQDSHVSEALQHAQAAALQGKQGYPDDLVKQAQEAITHARQAAKGTTNPHLTAGISALEQAIEHGKGGRNEDATRAAEEAVAHLSQVTAAPASAPPEESGY